MHTTLKQTLGTMIFAAVGMTAFVGTAQAVDGVVLITQARAFAGNVTPGDLPGFPVTISRSGSYRLASNLSLAPPSPCQSTGTAGARPCGIDVIADDVTLDLNGFTIDGAFSELGVVGADQRNVAVSNGTIKNVIVNGLRLGSDSRVEDVRLILAGSAGAGESIVIGQGCTVVGNTIADADPLGAAIQVNGDGCLIADNTIVNIFGSGVAVRGSGCTITGNTIDNNSRNGIDVDGACTIAGNTVTQGGGFGIRTGEGSVVRGNTVRGNGGVGIEVGDDCLVAENTASENDGDGINVGRGCTVKDNTSNNNQGDGIEGIEIGGAGTFLENSAVRNTGDGIRAGAGSTLKHNTASQNGDDGIDAFAASLVLGNSATANVNFGLRLGFRVGYGHNVVAANNGGDANPQVFSGTEIDTNLCGTDTVCP